MSAEITPGDRDLARLIFTNTREERETAAQLIADYRESLLTTKSRECERLIEQNRELREALEQCFHHLGREIKRNTLNETADLGTQQLSMLIAKTLDSDTP